MPHELHKVPFGPELFEHAATIDCGPEPWSQLVTRYIRTAGDGGALQDLKRKGNEAWLYYGPDEQLVGFGSLGQSRWPWPSDSDPRQAVSLIPFMGVDQRFRGVPKGDGEVSFGRQILRDLMAEASHKDGRLPLLALFVDVLNDRAKTVYADEGFIEIPHMTDEDENGRYQGMAIWVGDDHAVTK